MALKNSLYSIIFLYIDVFNIGPFVGIMVPKNQSTPFTNNRERGIIKQKEQKNHDTKDIHSGIQDEACPRGGP